MNLREIRIQAEVYDRLPPASTVAALADTLHDIRRILEKDDEYDTTDLAAAVEACIDDRNDYQSDKIDAESEAAELRAEVNALERQLVARDASHNEAIYAWHAEEIAHRATRATLDTISELLGLPGLQALASRLTDENEHLRNSNAGLKALAEHAIDRAIPKRKSKS